MQLILSKGFEQKMFLKPKSGNVCSTRFKMEAAYSSTTKLSTHAV